MINAGKAFKNVLGLPKSGGQARLSDLETLGLARCSHVESLSSVDHPSTLDQLEVRKAGVVHPLFLRGRNTFCAKPICATSEPVRGCDQPSLQCRWKAIG